MVKRSYPHKDRMAYQSSRVLPLTIPRRRITPVLIRNRAPKIKGGIVPFGGRKELKYIDTAKTLYNADTTGTVTFLNLTAIGDDNTSRDGREITIKSVQIRGLCSNANDDTTLDSLARVLLVWDNSVNANALTAAQYIAAIMTATDSIAFPLVDASRRFTILADQQFAMGKTNNGATVAISNSPNTYPVNIYKKLNTVTKYIGTTAAQGSIENGGLLMVTLGSAAAGTAPCFQLATRVRFTDN